MAKASIQFRLANSIAGHEDWRPDLEVAVKQADAAHIHQVVDTALQDAGVLEAFGQGIALRLICDGPVYFNLRQHKDKLNAYAQAKGFKFCVLKKLGWDGPNFGGAPKAASLSF